MPVVIRNKTNYIEIDVSVNLKYTVSKGGYDVIYEDIGDGIPYVYLVFRSNTLTNNTIKLDWRDCSSPDTTFTSAENLRDTLCSWNILKTSVNDSALPSGASTSANQTDGSQVAKIKGATGDTTYQVPRIDPATHTLQTIDYEHHEIHSGSHFFYTDKVTLASAATQDYLITTPNTTKWAHCIFMVTGSAITQIDLYEASDKNGTTLQTVFNSDRNSATTATTTIHKGISGGSTDGTLIWTRKSGSAAGASRTGMEASHQGEKILKQNTKYILRITSGTADNLTNVQIDWYEHINKSA